MDKTRDKYSAWSGMLTDISKDDDFCTQDLSGRERGVVFSLLASPPALLSALQIGLLEAIELKWSAKKKLDLRGAVDANEVAVEDREKSDLEAELRAVDAGAVGGVRKATREQHQETPETSDRGRTAGGQMKAPLTVDTTIPYAEWEHVIGDLDAVPNELPKKAQDFIISLRENPPARLTEPQVDWLRDLEKAYL